MVVQVVSWCFPVGSFFLVLVVMSVSCGCCCLFSLVWAVFVFGVSGVSKVLSDVSWFLFLKNVDGASLFDLKADPDGVA